MTNPTYDNLHKVEDINSIIDKKEASLDQLRKLYVIGILAAVVLVIVNTLWLDSIRKQAITHGCAEYSSTTGRWNWK